MRPCTRANHQLPGGQAGAGRVKVEGRTGRIKVERRTGRLGAGGRAGVGGAGGGAGELTVVIAKEQAARGCDGRDNDDVPCQPCGDRSGWKGGQRERESQAFMYKV